MSNPNHISLEEENKMLKDLLELTRKYIAQMEGALAALKTEVKAECAQKAD